MHIKKLNPIRLASQLFNGVNLAEIKERIKKSLIPSGGVSGLTVKGSFWLFALRGTDQFLRLIRTIILARLLAPNDFGLFGIVIISISLLDTFSQTGFQQALIQKKEDIKSYLNTGWVVQVIRGLLLALVLFLTAPYIATFFKTPAAELILKVVSLVIILQSLSNIAIVYFQKELEFHKYFIYQIAGTITDFTVAVSAAFIFRSVWALIFGFLAGNLVRCVISYIIHPYRPRFYFSFSKARELFGFGKWIFGSQIMVFFILQGDSLFVGRFLGVIALGFYQMAYKISSALGTEIISGAIFPAYTKLQDNLPKLREAHLKILQLLSFILIPLTGGIFILAPEFTSLFLGEKWLPIVSAIRVLVLATLIWAIVIINGPMVLAIGKPKIETKWVAVRLIVLLVLIYPFIIHWGILGASMAVFLSALVSTTGYSLEVIKITSCGGKNFIKRIIIPLINTIFMALVIFGLKTIMPIELWEFFLLVGVGVLVYLVLTYLSDKFLRYKMQSIIKECLNLLIK